MNPVPRITPHKTMRTIVASVLSPYYNRSAPGFSDVGRNLPPPSGPLQHPSRGGWGNTVVGLAVQTKPKGLSRLHHELRLTTVIAHGTFNNNFMLSAAVETSHCVSFYVQRETDGVTLMWLVAVA